MFNVSLRDIRNGEINESKQQPNTKNKNTFNKYYRIIKNTKTINSFILFPSSDFYVTATTRLYIISHQA